MHWFPALAAVRLAQRNDSYWDPPKSATEELGLSVLSQFHTALGEARYTVIEEETDDIIGLSHFPWPEVDSNGRLHFDVNTNPMTTEHRRGQLQRAINDARGKWSQLGVGDQSLIRVPLEIGQTFATWLHPPDPGDDPDDPPDPKEWVERRLLSLDPVELTEFVDVTEFNWIDRLHRMLDSGLFAHALGDCFRSEIALVDVSWDARQLAKLAHLAGSSGSITANDATGRYESQILEATERRLHVLVADGGIQSSTEVDEHAPLAPRDDGGGSVGRLFNQ